MTDSLRGKPNRAAMHSEYEKLEAKYAEARVARDHARSLGDYRGQRRQQARMDRLDAESSAIFQKLFPPHIGSTLDAPEPLSSGKPCDYCGSAYILTESEAFQTGGVCVRCLGGEVDPRNPNWTWRLDSPESPDYHRRQK